MRRPQGVNVLPFEFRLEGRKTTWRLWIEDDFGACLSRIDAKRDRVAKEKTCRERALFRLLSFCRRSIETAAQRLPEAFEIQLKCDQKDCPVIVQLKVGTFSSLGKHF